MLCNASVVYYPIPPAAVATVAAAVAVAGCNERESWLLCGVSACVCGCEWRIQYHLIIDAVALYYTLTLQ
jgi:hypothetical protein